MAREKPHHHGNLRAELIAAGIALIRDGGPDALSIRKAAAAVGVSHAAPAHHFPSLADFRTAIVAQGFRIFTQTMQAQIDAAGPDPRAILLAASRGYLDFATEHPGIFHLMFAGPIAGEDNPDLQEAASEAFDVLLHISEPIADNGAGAQGNALFVWSLVHGLAHLTIAERGTDLLPGKPADRIAAILPALNFRPPES